jgi:hypothetical protein
MSDETKNELPVESGNTVDEAFDIFNDSVSDLAIPEPVKKNLLKAVDRILCALIDIPVQKLQEGPAERRALLEERIKFIRAVNAQNMQHIEADPEFAVRASRTFTHRILRERLNLEKVFSFVIDIFRKKKYDDSADQQANSEPEKTISEDWFSIFEKEASQKSTEDMQRRFAQVLVGEIEKPGSHSIKAVKALGDMDQRVTMYFNAFCSLCIVNLDNPRLLMASPPIFKIRDARVPIIKGDFKEAYITNVFISDEELRVLAQESEFIYKTYGFGFKEFQLLSEYGLIESTTTMEYDLFWYNDELWGILKPSSYPLPTSEDYKEVTISGYALTSVGRELFHITKRSSPLGYFEKITQFLRNYYDVNIVKLPKR